MALKMRVTYTDGRKVDVLAGPKALVLTERQFKTGMSAENPLLEHVYFLAWIALHKSGKEPQSDFDLWLDTVDDVESLEPDEEVEAAEDPTPPAPSDDESSS